MQSHVLSSTIEILMARFHGQILIPFAAAVKCVGIPEQTARNKLSKGIFPIPTVMSGSRRQIHVQDLATYVESLRSPPPKKRGPKTKASKFQTAKEGGVQ